MASRDRFRAQLREAMAQVPEAVLTDEHRVILTWLAGWDDQVVNGVCSLLRLAAAYAGGPAGEPASVRDAYDPHRTPGGGEVS
ncbi:hypothetical protein [Streptomonospora sp. PA3]|uniref:hypothetical protein n=1 Tax=Streptomonospora sp. PA3 TaxID=2607326 RepID=UPI0012DC6DDD|nr:hypothetical protein [Streptomonospora sp. PA3]